MEKTITYVGLDVHKETISVAVAAGGLRWEARYFGIIENRPTKAGGEAGARGSQTALLL